MIENFLKVVIHAPEIPGNTGSIGRTCVALNCELILIKPYAFEITEKAVRRAGLDYWKHLRLKEYDSWDDFLAGENPPLDQLFFFENHAQKTVYEASFTKNCYLIFGGETRGIPNKIEKQYSDNFYKLPMFSPHIRSLNLANSVTAVTYLALEDLL